MLLLAIYRSPHGVKWLIRPAGEKHARAYLSMRSFADDL